MMTLQSIVAENPGPLGENLSLVSSTSSTNDDLKMSSRRGNGEVRVLVADHQTAGRGRLGRRWHSPPSVNIYLSLLTRPNALNDAPPLALVAGLAVAEAVEETSGVVAKVKWPNDVLVGARRLKKLAGVLCEAVVGPPPALVIGIGINVNQESFPPELRDIATSLILETGAAHRREPIIAALLRRLHLRLTQAENGSLDAVLARWSERSSTLGHRVQCADGLVGKAERTTSSGALVVTDDRGAMHQVMAGPLFELD